MRIEINLSTHDAGGISRRDFTLAQRINRLPAVFFWPGFNL